MTDEEKKDEGVKEAVEKGVVALVGKAYDDLAHGPAQRIGNILETLLGRLDARFAPLRLSNAVDDAEERISLSNAIMEVHRKHGVTDERLIEPSAKVAFKALRGYVLEDSSEVRKKYINLLARAMDKVSAAQVHPSFVAVLDQIAPSESLIIDALAKQPIYPVTRMMAVYPSTGRKVPISRNFSAVAIEAAREHPEMAQVYIGNLARLGVVAVEQCACKEEHGNYEVLKMHPALLKEQEEYNKGLPLELKQEQQIEYIKYHLRLTNFGTRLVGVCVET